MSAAVETLAAVPTRAAVNTIEFHDVSKFYGEVLGVNRINLIIPVGITSLVGPNGSGKTTLMNLMTGLIRPTGGAVSVLGLSPKDPENYFRAVGYCTQFDSFPKGITGREFVEFACRLHGWTGSDVTLRAAEAIERTGMTAAADRKVAAYSKGMRQRIRLAQSIVHSPRVLVLDEPLNGLDPMARAETLALFQQFAKEGCHVILSSHILHEVDQISDQVILLDYGYVVAEGQIHGVREEMRDRPMQVLVRCSRPQVLAARAFQMELIVEARLIPADERGGAGLLLRTADATRFYLALNDIVLEEDIELESVAPADDDVLSVYQYLIEEEGGSA